MSLLSLDPSARLVLLRRLCFASLVIGTVWLLAWRTLAILQINGLTTVKVATFVLFVLLLLPLALAFWTAVIGFLVQLGGGDSLELTRRLDQRPSAGLRLPASAVVMPVYNEDPLRVFAGLKSTWQSLEQTGLGQHFDFFILSDTTDPELWVREEMAFADLRKEVTDPARVHYRNRRENLERKTGNIADFCANWGERFRYMIVLDADSIMSGVCLVNLVRLMEQNPGVGIVQAPPLPVNRQSLFGRLHQFAMHAYSTIFISGLNFWQGGTGNYWGHNAIIRIRPFVEHCRLPTLPGKQPLGGAILSHDFVEAAYMRRAGWKVYLASELRGSYEEMPSSLIGYAGRDRRWCQGNLQHARLLFTPRFHFVNRVHLWMGVMSYLASPLWLMLLALTTVEGLRENLGRHAYFSARRSLFPNWEISIKRESLLLFLFILALLFAPKILSLIHHLRNAERRAGFGGGLKLAASVLCEVISSSLLAPTLALLQARFVAAILMGRVVRWDAQDRGESATSFREAARRHWGSTLLGIFWPLLLWFTAPALLWWLAPVFISFALSIPISACSSRTAWGLWAEKRGLFLIPEELDPPDLLLNLDRELQQASLRPWAIAGEPLARVLENPEICETHLSLLSPDAAPKHPLREHYMKGLELKCVCDGPLSLSEQEKRDLLLDAESIRSLRRQLANVSRAA